MVKLFCMGNALMDTLINVEEETLNELNIEKNNMTGVNKERLLFLKDFFKDKNKLFQAGGSSPNTAVAAAQLGTQTDLYCVIGKDEMGEMFTKETKSSGVNCLFKIMPDEPTSNCVSLITPDSNRSFNSYFDTATKFCLDSFPFEELKSSDCFHLTAYTLNSESYPTIKKILDFAKQNNILISFDLANPLTIQQNKKTVKEICNDYADIKLGHIYCHPALHLHAMLPGKTGQIIESILLRFLGD